MSFPELIIDAEYGKIAVEIAGVGEEYQRISENFFTQSDIHEYPRDPWIENQSDLKRDTGSHQPVGKNRNFFPNTRAHMSIEARRWSDQFYRTSPNCHDMVEI